VKRLLLRLYPAEWRRRYGDELNQLVDDVGLGPSVVLDLARSGLRERASSLKRNLTGGDDMKLGPAWRHPTALAVLALAVLAPVLMFVVGSVLAYQLGVAALLSPLESVNAWLAPRRALDLVLVLSPAIAFILAGAPLLRLELRPGESGREAVLGVRLLAVNVVVGLLALGVGAVLAWHIVFELMMELGA
jgi:hypothetical protein